MYWHRFDADPDPNFPVDADPDPDWHQNNADPHADPTRTVGKSDFFSFSHRIATLQIKDKTVKNTV